MSLALAAIDEKPKAILIEKPACTPDLSSAKALVDKAASENVSCFVGYDHAVGIASLRMSEMLRSGICGAIEALDVEEFASIGAEFFASIRGSGPSGHLSWRLEEGRWLLRRTFSWPELVAALCP